MPSPRSPLFPYTTLFRSEKGQVLEGVIKNMTNFGVFIDLGGVDGLLHITDFSWRSEERFSRNAEPEISTLSLHDALPIGKRTSTRRCHQEHDQLRRIYRLGWRRRLAAHHRFFVEIGRAVQQECRARDLHSFPTRRSSDRKKDKYSKVSSRT